VSFQKVHWMNFGWGEEKDEQGNVGIVHHPEEVWMR